MINNTMEEGVEKAERMYCGGDDTALLIVP
jgi:hypothetical protein